MKTEHFNRCSFVLPFAPSKFIAAAGSIYLEGTCFIWSHTPLSIKSKGCNSCTDASNQTFSAAHWHWGTCSEGAAGNMASKCSPQHKYVSSIFSCCGRKTATNTWTVNHLAWNMFKYECSSQKNEIYGILASTLTFERWTAWLCKGRISRLAFFNFRFSQAQKLNDSWRRPRNFPLAFQLEGK